LRCDPWRITASSEKKPFAHYVLIDFHRVDVDLGSANALPWASFGTGIGDFILHFLMSETSHRPRRCFVQKARSVCDETNHQVLVASNILLKDGIPVAFS